MKAFKKLSVMILACLLMVSISGKTAFASSGTISLSDPTAAVGESVSVTVKVTTSDSSKIGSVTMELTYDPKILDFQEGTSATNEDGIVKISGTADTAIKTYTLTFKALSSGTSAIKISSYDIQDSKAAKIEMSKVGSSTVTITGDVAQGTTATDSQTGDSTTTDTQTEGATTTDAQTQEVQNSIEDKIVNPPKKDVEVEIAGTPFYICKISKDIIPEGFEYIGYQYGDVAVDAVRKDNIVLFYLNQIGEEPYIFYLYDDASGGFFQYAPVTPALDYSVIDSDESVVIPEGYTATEVSVGGVAVNGWQSNTNSEYYLLYLMTSEGEKNLYSYDAVEKTVQRYDSSSTTATTTDESTDSYQKMYTDLNANYNADMQSKTRVIYGLIVLAVILVFFIINLALRLSDKRHPIIEEEEEEEENDYEEEYSASNEFEDEYDEEDDDYEDEIEEKSDRQLKKEMKKAAKLEKKEMLQREKAAKKAKKTSKEDQLDEFENSEDDFDDSDDFEMQIFDFDKDKK